MKLPPVLRASRFGDPAVRRMLGEGACAEMRAELRGRLNNRLPVGPEGVMLLLRVPGLSEVRRPDLRARTAEHGDAADGAARRRGGTR
jgi:hypothetical protein